MNFDMNDALASRWLTKDDVPTQGVDLSIRNVTQEMVGGDGEQVDKFALHFHGSYKPMLLNKTNIRILVALLGANTQSWMNRAVCVYNDPTIAMGGKLVGGLRVRAAQQPQNAPQLPGVPAGQYQPPPYQQDRLEAARNMQPPQRQPGGMSSTPAAMNMQPPTQEQYRQQMEQHQQATGQPHPFANFADDIPY